MKKRVEDKECYLVRFCFSRHIPPFCHCFSSFEGWAGCFSYKVIALPVSHALLITGSTSLITNERRMLN